MEHPHAEHEHAIGPPPESRAPATPGPDADRDVLADPFRLGRTRTRLIAAAVLAPVVTVLGIAVYLNPDARGLGTHEQLGLAPCGMIVTTGYPCPTCGMTTAFADTVRGRFLAAAYAQPAGLLLALATIVVALGAGWALVTGRIPFARRLVWFPVHAAFLVLVGAILAGWGAKLLIGTLDGSLPVR